MMLLPHSDHIVLILLLIFWTLALLAVVNNRIAHYRREKREREREIREILRRLEEAVKGSK